ncbi:hypothetical protein [Nocardia amikacinitolerans]|uniref:hypothetical protein n=1 Tax=Nocardia amikacinitolerans TaxID=756689 RepID=UPI0020A61BDC|nr:hypothetical protein [Nocardia amikacinitolerans]MCP2278455.1 hypothetical protein [Nocardia amikacinitolerans]
MADLPPDLFDADWAREAERRALRDHRRATRAHKARRLIRPSRGALLSTLALSLAVVLLWAGFTFLDGTAPSASAPASTTASTSTAPLRKNADIDPTRPFADTPAAMWREGAGGIEPPPAYPVGRYSAEQVGQFMERVRQLIITARLDRTVLETGDLSPVLALLAPHMVERLAEELAPGHERESWYVAERIAPDFRLLPVQPRVIGSMTPTINDEGELALRTNYLVAYAFEAPDPAKLDGPMDIVALVRQEIEFRWIDDPKYAADSMGIWYGEVDGFNYSVGCAQLHLGLLAPSYSNPPGTGSATPPARRSEEYFDPNIPMPNEDGCP